MVVVLKGRDGSSGQNGTQVCHLLLLMKCNSHVLHSRREDGCALDSVSSGSLLFSWARHFALTVPLFTQVYKWVPVNLLLRVNPAMD